VCFLVVNDSSVGEGALDRGGTLPLCANWTKQRNSAAYASMWNNATPTSANLHVLLRYMSFSKKIANCDKVHYFP